MAVLMNVILCVLGEYKLNKNFSNGAKENLLNVSLASYFFKYVFYSKYV